MKIALLAAVICAASAGAAQAGDVVVTISGVQERGGAVLASLQTREQFMKPAGASLRQDTPAVGTLTLRFKDVEPGEYAVSVLHDEDGDGRLRTAPNAMPMEGVGIVGGEALRGPPTFDLVKFTVPAAGAAVKASMIYFDGKFPTGPAGG